MSLWMTGWLRARLWMNFGVVAPEVTIVSSMRSGDVRVRASVAALAVVAFAAAGTACTRPHAGTLPPPSAESGAPFRSSIASATTSGSTDTSLRLALINYIRALNEASRQPDAKTMELARLVAPRCSCRRTIAALNEEAHAGRYIDYQYRITSMLVVDVGNLGGDINYTVARSSGAERTRDGRLLKTFPPATEHLSAHFVRSGETWLLSRVTKFK